MRARGQQVNLCTVRELFCTGPTPPVVLENTTGAWEQRPSWDALQKPFLAFP